MPQTVRVPALKPLKYQGRSYVRGDLVVMAPIDAAVYGRRGEVGLDGQVVEKAPVRKRRTYRRRDMTAERATDE